MSRHRLTVILSCLALAACGPARNSPATQGTITAFDASKSEPKAVEIADQVLAALGGEANWNKAREISWTQLIIIDGKLQDHGTHAWDRWNGRHNYKRLYADGNASVAMHELFSTGGTAYIQTDKGSVEQTKDDQQKIIAEARKRFDTDTYITFLPYKLKDPGVKLKFSEERQEEGAPADAPMKYDVIQITFDEGVGPGAGDTWYLSVDKETKIPNMVEHVGAGKPDNERGGFLLEEWKEAGGLKFATKRVTLGYTKLDAPKVKVAIPPNWVKKVGALGIEVPTPGEVVLIQDLKVSAEPDDELYIPQVRAPN
jgi:hypothetical protein